MFSIQPRISLCAANLAPGYIGIPSDVPAPRLVSRFGNSYSLRLHGIGEERISVIENPKALVALDQVRPIVGATDTQRLSQFARTIAQLRVPLGFGSGEPHSLKTAQWLQRADKDPSPIPAGSVRTPVHTVTEVDVEMPGRTEHGGVPLGLTAIRMGGGILSACVGFHLDYPTTAPIGTHEDLPQKFGGHFSRVARVKSTR